MEFPYRVVIFDADGTLTPFREGATGKFSYTLLPGVAERCAELQAHGVILAIASNQSRHRNRDEIIAQLAWTAGRLQIAPRLTLFEYTHSPTAKPAAFMLNQILDSVSIETDLALMVGDQDSDAQAARNAAMSFCYAPEFFSYGTAIDTALTIRTVKVES